MVSRTNTTENILNQDTSIYWLAVIMPLAMILVSFVSGGWGWGLMDDTNLVALPGGVGQRFSELFYNLLDAGRFQPIAVFHAAFFYKVFAANPGGFYIFRWFEVVLGLSSWAWLSYRLTGEKIAAPLFMSVVLSFYKVYDGFFYLSIHEVLGVLFSGLACFFLFTGIEETKKSFVSRGRIVVGIFCLLAAFGDKETFIATGIAVGVTFLILSFNKRERKTARWIGGVLLAATFLYGIFLKVYISKLYSAAYAITDTAKIKYNMILWMQKPLLYHLPWLILAAILMIAVKNKEDRKLNAPAIYLGVTLYMAYLLIILPWSTWGHYALPLGVFFAFLISVLIAEKMRHLDHRLRNTILIGAMFFTAFVSWTALRDQFIYQKDTASLVEWLAENPIFEHDIQTGGIVRGNADEPCVTIPEKVEMLYHKKYPNFIFTSSVREILADPQTRYYLWGRTWGDQDLRLIGHDSWAPMFVSENWIMFRRMY